MFGSILGAVAGNVISGMFADEAAEDSRAHQDQVNAQNAALAREQQAENIKLQREFAQHGIRWKVEDAVAAGLHPLLGAGGAGAAYAPNPVVLPHTAAPSQSRTGWEDFGSQVARSIQAQETAEQRSLRLLNEARIAAATEKDFAEASYWRSKAAKEQSDGMSSASMPSSAGAALLGQSDSFNLRWPGSVRSTDGIVSMQPAKITTRAEGDRSMEAGVNPAHSLFTPDKKGLHEIVAPSKELKERFEDLPLLMQAYYGLRNLPVLGQWLVQEGYDAVDSRRGHGLSGVQSRSGRIRPALTRRDDFETRALRYSNVNP